MNKIWIFSNLSQANFDTKSGYGPWLQKIFENWNQNVYYRFKTYYFKCQFTI